MFIQARVHPKSSQEKITQKPDGSWHIFIHSPAQDNLANEAAIKLLAEHLKFAKSRITILKGQRSRNKTFYVAS